jgi:hypothetical protein
VLPLASLGLVILECGRQLAGHGRIVDGIGGLWPEVEERKPCSSSTAFMLFFSSKPA